MQVQVQGQQPSTKAAVDAAFAQTGVFYRSCPQCQQSHQTIYYKRLTMPVGSWSAYDNMFVYVVAISLPI